MAIRENYRNNDAIGMLVGETLTEIKGMEKGSETVTFRAASGRTWSMYYDHDCCASCDIEDVCGAIAVVAGIVEEPPQERPLGGPGGPVSLVLQLLLL